MRNPRRLALAARIAFLLYACALSTMTHWPRLAVPMPVEGSDLLYHLVGFAIWGALLALTGILGAPGTARSLLLTSSVGVAFAAIDEATQARFVPGRIGDPNDLIANSLGVLLGALAAYLFAKRAIPAHNPDATAPTPLGIGRHARIFGGLTLVSRVAGLVRDATIAATLGATAVSSAFFTAFMIPNIFRRLFGEGALTAAFLPKYAEIQRDDPLAAERFASLTLRMTSALLWGLTALIELALIAIVLIFDPQGDSRLVVALLAVMLPFMPLVCLTAIRGAILQSHGRFGPSGGAPIILNLAMIAALMAGAWVLLLPETQLAVMLACAVVLAGVIQLAWCAIEQRTLDTPRTKGRAHPEDWRRLGAMGRLLIPVLIGLGATQLGLLIDTAIAAYPLASPTILGAQYPLETNAASSLYFAQRLYQLPLGVFSIAIATAAFPKLSREAATPAEFAKTLCMGLRLSLYIGIPAAVGLAVLAEPVVRSLYLSEAFTSEDATRVAWLLLAYCAIIPAAGVTHMLSRAFYAKQQMRTPMKVGIAAVALNIVLSASLMWPLGPAGLALASSIAAIFQATTLGAIAKRSLLGQSLNLAPSALMSLLGAALMGAAVLAASQWLAPHLRAALGEGRSPDIALVASMVALGGVAYLLWSLATRRPEFRDLTRRAPR